MTLPAVMHHSASHARAKQAPMKADPCKPGCPHQREARGPGLGAGSLVGREQAPCEHSCPWEYSVQQLQKELRQAVTRGGLLWNQMAAVRAGRELLLSPSLPLATCAPPPTLQEGTSFIQWDKAGAAEQGGERQRGQEARTTCIVVTARSSAPSSSPQDSQSHLWLHRGLGF